MYEIRAQVTHDEQWQETDAKLMEAAGRPNDFFWCRPDIDNGNKNRGWLVKSFYKGQIFMKRLGKVVGVSVTMREATNRNSSET